MPLYADSAAPVQCGSPEASSSLNPPSALTCAINKVRSALNTGATHLVDGMLLFDARKTPTAVNITVLNPGQNLASPQTDKVINLWLAGVTKKSAGDTDPVAGNSASDGGLTAKQLFATASLNAKSMSLAAKLLTLSWYGNTLNQGYDTSLPLGSTSEDALLKNARANGGKGGICRDIHAFLRDLATALGFTDAGLHGGNAKDYKTGGTAAHVIAHFRDPETGEFYVLDYDKIINTHEKSLTRAVDVSTTVMGTFSGATYVESKPGVMHVYQPLASRWVGQQLESQTGFANTPTAFATPGYAPPQTKERSVLTLRLGNREQTVGAEVGTPNTKAFFLHSAYDASNGHYQIDAIGVAGQVGANWRSDRRFTEIGYAVSAYAGGMRIATPILSPESDSVGQTDSHLYGFLGTKAAGYARIGPVTGKLEFQMRALDLGNPAGEKGPDDGIPWHSLNASVQVAPSGKPYYGSVTRNFEVGVKAWNQMQPDIRTAFDKLNLVVDTRGKNTKLYVMVDSSLYLFGGTEKMDAVGVREKIKAAYSTAHLGEVGIIGDLSGMVSNKAGDPFYKHPWSVSLGLNWQAQINQVLSIGADLVGTNGNRPFVLFEEPGTVIPEMGHVDGNELHGDLWARARF
jgi:hypothetical protein